MRKIASVAGKKKKEKKKVSSCAVHLGKLSSLGASLRNSPHPLRCLREHHLPALLSPSWLLRWQLRRSRGGEQLARPRSGAAGEEAAPQPRQRRSPAGSRQSQFRLRFSSSLPADTRQVTWSRRGSRGARCSARGLRPPRHPHGSREAEREAEEAPDRELCGVRELSSQTHQRG